MYSPYKIRMGRYVNHPDLIVTHESKHVIFNKYAQLLLINKSKNTKSHHVGA